MHRSKGRAFCCQDKPMKIAKNIIFVLSAALVLDLAILTAGLTQIAVEGRTGYWSPFWIVQAQAVLSILK